MKQVLNIYYNGSTNSLAGIFVHLSSVDHQTTLIAARATHEPLPQNAVDALEDDSEHVDPR